MKKIIITLLLLAAMLFTACESSPSLTPDASTSLLPSASATAQPSPTPDAVVTTDIFEISHKKYEYQGSNLTVLNIKNVTDNDYNVTLTAKYLDANGNTLKTDKKTFEGFPGKWENNFFFQPEIKYESFEVEVSTTPFSGKTYVRGYDINGTGPAYIKLIQAYSDSECNLYLWQATPDCKLMTCVFAAKPMISLVFECEGTLGAKSQSLVIDANGVILNVSKVIYEGNMTSNPVPYEGESLIGICGTQYTWAQRDKYVAPDNLKSLTLIDSILWVGEE